MGACILEIIHNYKYETYTLTYTSTNYQGPYTAQRAPAHMIIDLFSIG